MLYVGRKLEFSGYVRVEARPATAWGFMPSRHSTTAWPSTSIPRRPARPVSCVYSPGVMSTRASPLNLSRRSSTTERAGMLIPSARVSVAKTALMSPSAKSCSTSLKTGSMPAWGAEMPRTRPSYQSS